MKASRSSKTAAQMALSRAIEAREPVPERICDDPFAARFLDRRYRILLAARPLRRGVVEIIERLFAGHHHYVLARTRWFDAFLLGQLAAGAQQVVILGAGFDSRPYRFADRLQQTPVFEVDHPATSRAKRATLEAVLGALPANVRLVPVDFNRDDLGERLREAGYRPDRRTIFLWEGTVPYLDADAVDATLRLVAAASSGSTLMFDYVLDTVIDGTCTFRGAATEHRRMKKTPEPFTFGIGAGRILRFLEERGFRDVRDVGADELKAGFPAARATAYVKPWWRIANATVA